MKSNDIATKDFEAFPDVAADIVNALLHKGEKIVRPENLLPAPTETIYQGAGETKNQMEDLAKYEFIGQELTMVYLLANQTTVDRHMLIRKAGYVGGCYREQYNGKHSGICPVVELVLYWGKKRWNSPRSMRHMFRKKEIPEQTWKYIDNMKLCVWEMRYLPEEIRERFTGDMRIVVDYLAEGDSYRSDRKIIHKEALINMLRSLSGDVDFEETRIFMEEMNIREEDDIMACELFDQYVRKGREEGREEGRKTGREEGILLTIHNFMKELNLTAEEALKAAGIPPKEWSKYESKLG